MARRNSVDQIVHLDQFQCEAMMAEITRNLQQEFNMTNHANEFLEFVTPASRKAGAARIGARRSERKEAEEEYLEPTSSRGVRAQAGGDHASHHRRPRAEEHLSQSKLGIPSFLGKIDHDAYLEWEEEMELVFSYHYYTEAKKIKLATSGFSGHAIHWWDQIASTRRRNGEPQITSWFEMKIVMKKRFAPDYNQFGYVQDSPHQRRSKERTNGSRSEMSKAVRSSQGKGPSSCPSSNKWTRQEHLSFKEKPALPQPESNHPSPICKGKKEKLNLKDFSNESFICNYRKQITRRLFVESADNNNEEKKEVSETSSSPPKVTVSRSLFGTEKFSNDSITGKCDLPSSQIDSVLIGKEICRELTFFEPASPSSLVFSPQDFEEDTPEEVPKKVPPARDMESSSDAKDAIGARGVGETLEPLSNSCESETSLAEDETMVKGNLCEFNKDPFSVPSVSVLDETCIGLTNLKPVQPSIREFSLQDHENQLPDKTPMRMPLDSSLALTTNLVLKPPIHSFRSESRLKLCKDIGVPSSLPSLFVFVTPDEEKQFGLENVKELCVSGFVFDKMIQSFETPKYETFSRPECSLFAETLDFRFALNLKLVRRTLGHKMFEIDADLMIDECFSNKVLHNLKSVRTGCEILCCEDFWVLKPCDMNLALKENVFGSLSKLDHEFALLDLWFKNMRALLRAKRRSEFEYVETASKLAQSNLFASNYISLFGLCSKEKFYSSECSNARMTYDLILDGDSRNLNLVFKVLNVENSVVYFCCTFDVVFLVFVKKQDRQVMEFVPRTRRIQGLDKQVDYGPKEHLIKEWYQNRARIGLPQQSYQFGAWIWELTWQPLPTIQGKLFLDHHPNVFNLFSCVADELDLRSNPSKGGGDGAIQEGDQSESSEEDLSADEDDGPPDEGDGPPDSGDGLRPRPRTDQLGPIRGGAGPWGDGPPDDGGSGGGRLDQREVGLELGQGEFDQTAHKEEEENPAQVKELTNLWIGPTFRSRAEIQRKPILQVAWAWLRRKRKKPRRIKQLGLFNCCIFCN